MYIFLLNCEFCGRRGGLMVSALVPGSSGPGSSPGQGILLQNLHYKEILKLFPGFPQPSLSYLQLQTSDLACSAAEF